MSRDYENSLARAYFRNQLIKTAIFNPAGITQAVANNKAMAGAIAGGAVGAASAREGQGLERGALLAAGGAAAAHFGGKYIDDFMNKNETLAGHLKQEPQSIFASSEKPAATQAVTPGATPEAAAAATQAATPGAATAATPAAATAATPAAATAATPGAAPAAGGASTVKTYRAAGPRMPTRPAAPGAAGAAAGAAGKVVKPGLGSRLMGTLKRGLKAGANRL